MPEPGLAEPEEPGRSVPAARRLAVALAYIALVAVGATATFFALGGDRSAAPGGRGGIQVQPLSGDEAAGLVTSPRATPTATAGPSVTPDPTPTPTAAPVVPGGTGGGSTGGGSTGAPVYPPPTTAQPPPTTQAPPPAPTVADVPDVMGYNEQYAAEQVRAAGLFPSVTYEYSPNKCYVISQNPVGGTTVPIGSTVNLRVAWLIGPNCELI